MKYFLLALTFALLLSGAASAGGITCGFKGGINLSDLTGEGIEGNEMKIVGGGGIFCNYAVTDIISVQPEALYMMKGTKSETLENTGIHLTYIDIPLLVKFSVPTESDFVPSFFAGPSFGILNTATYEVALEEEDIKDDLESIDYGLVLGAGIDYRIGKGRLLLDVRYSFGLLTILDEEHDEGEDVRNTGIMLMVGYGHSF